MSRIDVKKMLFDKDYIVNNPKMSLHAVTWNGQKIKKVHKAGKTELSNNVGNKVKVIMENIANWGSVSFGKDSKGNDLTMEYGKLLGDSSKIKNNFALLFSDANFSQLKPEIANVLSDKQKLDIYKTFSSLHFMLSKIYDLSAVVNPNEASYKTITRYMEEITEASKLCRDIHESALSSETFIDRKKQEALRGSETFTEVESALKNDLIMAFAKMGWDISNALQKSSLDDIESALNDSATVEVGGVSPFEKGDVATFIYNYINLSEEQKRGFSIPRLFEVYGETAKRKIQSDFSFDEVEMRHHLETLDGDMQRDFGESGWRLTHLAGDGSLMRYSKEMMNFIHSADIAREERKTLGNANTDSVRLAGVSGLELVIEDLQDESQLESLREEIKKPFLEAIAKMPTKDNDFKIDKSNPIVRNYMSLLATEKHGIMGGYVSDITEGSYFIELCQEVYDHYLDSSITNIISKNNFLEKNGFAMTTAPNPTPSGASSPAPAKEEIDEIKAIIENAENAELLKTYLSLDGNADAVTKHLEGLDDTAKANLESKIDKDKLPLYCAAKTLIENARTKCGKKDTPIADLWESAKEEISEACNKQTRDDLFVDKKDVFTLNNVYRVGVFHDLVEACHEKLLAVEETFDGDEATKKREREQFIGAMVDSLHHQSGGSTYEDNFYNAIQECLIAGGDCATNKFYQEMLERAKEEIIINKYSKHISELQEKSESGDLTPEEQAEVDAWNEVMSQDEDKVSYDKLLEQAQDHTPKEKEPSEADILTEAKNKDAVKIYTLGDKKVFDAAGFAKKLKPFNVKAGQKYLEDLIKAINKVKITELTAADARGSDKPGPDHDDTPGTKIPGDITPSTGTPNGVPTNPNYTPEELKEKAAFYIMGKALDQSLSETLNLGGLTDEDRARLLSEQKDMKELFDLLAFGEDKDQKYDFNNGKNTIKCSKIGYIQQIIYSKATDPNFKMDANELALVLAEGNAFGVGTREPSDTDAQYLDKILKHPRISAIIRSLESIKPEIACALIGITSTRDGKNCSFAGKVTDKILEGLKDAKTPEEIKSALEKMATVELENPAPGKYIRKAGPIAELLEDAKLDMAVANSRESFVKKVIDDIKKKIDINASKDDQKAVVFKYFESPEFADQLKTAGIGIARGTVTETMAAQEKRTIKEAIERGIFAEIEKGLTANANPVTPAFAFKLDGDSRQILKENVEMFMANGQLEYTENGKELIINVINSSSPELAEKLAKTSLEDFVKLIKEFESVSSDEYEME